MMNLTETVQHCNELALENRKLRIILGEMLLDMQVLTRKNYLTRAELFELIAEKVTHYINKVNEIVEKEKK